MTDDITVSRELLRQLQSLCMDVRKHSNLRMATLAIPLYDALRAALDATCQDSRQVQTAAEWVRCAAHGAQHDVREIIADMQTAPVQEPVAWWKQYPDGSISVVESRTFLAEDAVAMGWRALGFTDVAPQAQQPAPPAEVPLLTDAVRYKKLRRWMSSNVKEGWEEVERMGAVASWVGWDDFDAYLDALPECAVGLVSPPVSTEAASQKAGLP